MHSAQRVKFFFASFLCESSYTNSNSEKNSQFLLDFFCVFCSYFFNIINIRFTLVISKTKFRSGAKGLVVVGLWGLTEVLHLNYASSRQSRPKLHGSRPKLHPADRSNANFIAMSGMVAGLSAEHRFALWKSAQCACAPSLARRSTPSSVGRGSSRLSHTWS